jgi:hypothetical protein
MPLKKLGAPPYLLPDEVENNDLLEVVDKPFIVPAEKTKWGRERGKCTVRILRTGEVRRWTLNATTWDRLIDAFGEDAELWIGKKIKVKKESRSISGVAKSVLFGVAYREPQQTLSEPKPQASASSKLTLTPEQKIELTQLIDQQGVEPLQALSMVLTAEQMAQHTIAELLNLLQAEVK